MPLAATTRFRASTSEHTRRRAISSLAYQLHSKISSNMKSTKIFQCALIVMSVAILPSCNDFLDRVPISDATSENAYKTTSDAEAALVGAYDTFQAEYYVWDNII